MLKKLAFLLFALTFSMLALSSCAGMFGDDGDGTPAPQDKPTVFNKIITNDAELDILGLKSALADIVGPIISLGDDTAAVSDGEIVLGESGRAITAAAKQALAEELAKSSEYDCGYVVYSDGKSIAVYWQIEEMSTLAVADFIQTVLVDERLQIESGIALSEYYEKSAFEAERYWLNLKATESSELYSALKSLYSYFDGTKMLAYYANLYDPEVGGFYYSRSARDTETYLPDIESTLQALGALTDLGAVSDINSAIPNDIKADIVAFAKSLQSSEDGYFYHPQWPIGRDKLQIDRYGRDVSSATNVIRMLTVDTDGDGIPEKQYPNYCAPNGVKCEAAANGEVCNCVNAAVSSSVSASVSKVLESTVTPVASVSAHPDYTDADAFYNWLVAYNATIKTDSGEAHNLQSNMGIITEKGYSGIVLDYLDAILDEVYNEQTEAGDEPTGTWQLSVDYNLVWGLHKYMSWYNNGTHGRAVPSKYISYMVKSCIKVINLEADGSYRINDVYNQWICFNDIIKNIEKYYPEEEIEGARAEVYSIIKANASELIANTLLKVDPFAMTDGSFSYKSDGRSLTTTFGVPVSLGAVEGDANATSMAYTMCYAIVESLGLDRIPIATASDGEVFVSEILAAIPVEKNKLTYTVHEFEDGFESGVTVGTSGTEFSITEDPEYFDNKVLMMKSNNGVGDLIQFAPNNRGSACYIFECDIYVSSASDNGYLYQVQVGSKYIFTLTKSGNTVTVKDIPSTTHDLDQQVLMTFSTDEWNKIRFEFYTIGEEINELESPMTKVWLNGEFVALSDMYIGKDTGASASSNYNNALFHDMKTPASVVYIDNCFFATYDKAFDADDTDPWDFR